MAGHSGWRHGRIGSLGECAFLALSMFLCTGLSPAQKKNPPARAAGISIIPKPLRVEPLGDVFHAAPDTRIVIEQSTGEMAAVAVDLAEKLRKATGYPFNMSFGSAEKPRSAIRLTVRKSSSIPGPEGYVLRVGKNTITIEGSDMAGVFYGVQSLYQLFPARLENPDPAAGAAWTVPCVRITDKPRFRWRGVHLDVARHFFPKEFIKKVIDLASYHKLNIFHWHLTEDQGWRIEIKKYPRLTDFGAWRRQTMDDGKIHGGFYTQDDIREIIAYAKFRYVTIVPEIEMPGHSQAALASYPELSCSGGPFKVSPDWGVINDIYCAGNDKTFEFLENILTEVIDLFPGEYLHIGGDEAPKTRWQNCVKCQARIKTEGLKDESELQSWFVRRIEKFLNSKGRRLIGWDEILEGGLAPHATVMSWRGTDGGIDAARSGHDAVMSPTSHCYFDYYQGLYNEPRAIGGFLPLEKVYSYEPVPEALQPAEAKHILGAQANLWTEYIPEFQKAEYMLFPRLCALAEVVWTEKAQRSFQDFSKRMVAHYDRLAAKDINFRVPPPAGVGGRTVIFKPDKAALENPLPGAAEVRYTLDGTEPDANSPLYAQSLDIAGNVTLTAKTFLPNGRTSIAVNTVYALVDPEANGLAYQYFEGEWERMPDFSKLTPVRSGVLYDVSLDPIKARTDHFGLVMEGALQIEQDGEYTFTTNADEACRLYIDGQEAVPYWGPTWLRERTGTVKLAAGRRPLKINYFEDEGGQRLQIFIEGPQTPKQLLPPRLLFRK